GALRARRVRVAAEFVERRGDYLPGDAEAVLEPAAHRLLASALLQALPVVVDLLLVLAAHVHGDGFRELEVRAAVVGVETLPAHPERHARTVARDDLAVREHGGVELGRLPRAT